MTAPRLIALATILLVGAVVAAHGQTASTLPPGMTQEQFDATVDAVAKALVVKLKNEGVRAGEYIECGQTKGVVEGFTLRSIRIRHPNGQLHTVPFGDLGQIANFSRDWAIVKYDFSFPRDTDLEKVRHAVAGLDDEIQKDPEFKPQILEPLKMQGVVGVTDNTLVIQFRFAAQPGNPEAIRRAVMIRMMRAFQDQGIAFGSATAAS